MSATTLFIGHQRMYVLLAMRVLKRSNFRHLQAIQLLMRYFVGNEIGIANVIQRNFDVSSLTPLSPALYSPCSTVERKRFVV